MTGKLDVATIKQMKKPSRGMPDDGNMEDRDVTATQWKRKRLTYFVRKYGADLTKATQDDVFAKALKFWSVVSRLS